MYFSRTFGKDSNKSAAFRDQADGTKKFVEFHRNLECSLQRLFCTCGHDRATHACHHLLSARRRTTNWTHISTAVVLLNRKLGFWYKCEPTGGRKPFRSSRSRSTRYSFAEGLASGSRWRQLYSERTCRKRWETWREGKTRNENSRGSTGTEEALHSSHSRSIFPMADLNCAPTFDHTPRAYVRSRGSGSSKMRTERAQRSPSFSWGARRRRRSVFSPRTSRGCFPLGSNSQTRSDEPPLRKFLCQQRNRSFTNAHTATGPSADSFRGGSLLKVVGIGMGRWPNWSPETKSLWSGWTMNRESV